MKYLYLAMLVALAALLLVMQSSVVYADPTSTPIIVSTSQFQNLLPSPSPLPTSNATPMSLIDKHEDPKAVAYQVINVYRYFNSDGIFDWIATIAMGVGLLIWMFKLIRSLKRMD